MYINFPIHLACILKIDKLNRNEEKRGKKDDLPGEEEEEKEDGDNKKRKCSAVFHRGIVKIDKGGRFTVKCNYK